MSSSSSSPQALHLRWRVQACARVLLFALPWFAVAMCAALQAPSQVLAWMAVAASVLVTAAALFRIWRQHDVRWLASMLNTSTGEFDWVFYQRGVLISAMLAEGVKEAQKHFNTKVVDKERCV